MHKSCAQWVDDMRITARWVPSLIPRFCKIFYMGGYKATTFTQGLEQLLRPEIHRFFVQFTPVKVAVFPTFHTPYNKNNKSKLTNFYYL